MDIELIEESWGWAYRVGGVFQEYDPDCEGFVPMTKERAEEMAIVIKARLTNNE